MMQALPFPALTAILTLVVLVVMLRGGLASVVRSDVVSFVVTLVLLPTLLVIGTKRRAVGKQGREGIRRAPTSRRRVRWRVFC